MRGARFTLAALAAALAVPTTVDAQGSSPPAVETLTSYPNGVFLENLTTLADGTILFTSYGEKRVYRLSPDGQTTVFADLDVHPVAILPSDGGYLLTAHASSFFDGPGFVTSNRWVLLDRAGVKTGETAAPDARFLNGQLELAPDLFLAADSIAGRIWAFSPSSASISVWLADPLLETGDPASVRPGANGLKLHDGYLYISNSARGAIYRVPLERTRPAGPIELYADTGPVDDFAFLPDGRIVATTHGARLIAIATDGSVSDILASGCDSCTSVAVAADGRTLTILTTGNLFERGTEPARVLRMVMPDE